MRRWRARVGSRGSLHDCCPARWPGRARTGHDRAAATPTPQAAARTAGRRRWPRRLRRTLRWRRSCTRCTARAWALPRSACCGRWGRWAGLGGRQQSASLQQPAGCCGLHTLPPPPPPPPPASAPNAPCCAGALALPQLGQLQRPAALHRPAQPLGGRAATHAAAGRRRPAGGDGGAPAGQPAERGGGGRRADHLLRRRVQAAPLPGPGRLAAAGGCMLLPLTDPRRCPSAGDFSPLEAFLKFGFVPQELWA